MDTLALNKERRRLYSGQVVPGAPAVMLLVSAQAVMSRIIQITSSCP